MKNKQSKKNQNRKGSLKQDQKLERIINLSSSVIRLITAVLDIIKEL